MKRFILIVALLAVAITGSAQDKKWNISIGGGIAIPTDDAADFTKMGLDAFVSGAFSFSRKFIAGVVLGYASLPSKPVDTMDLENTSIKAFLLKGAYTFTEHQFRPYVAMFAGFYSSKICKCLYVDGNEVASTNVTDNDYGYGIEAGVRKGAFTLGIAYHVVEIDFKYVLVNLGYTFKF